MAKVDIYISLIPGTTRLQLDDSQGHSGEAHDFFTNVNRGDIVVWQLARNSGIDEITNINAKDTKFNILVDGAPKKYGSGMWIGVVKEDATGEDNYNIHYRIGSSDHYEDPTLKIPPPGNGG